LRHSIIEIKTYYEYHCRSFLGKDGIVHFVGFYLVELVEVGCVLFAVCVGDGTFLLGYDGVIGQIHLVELGEVREAVL